MDDVTKNQINSERTFLHDISSPLMIASGSLELIGSDLEEIDKEKLEKLLERATRNIKKIETMVHERRAVLKKEP